MSLIENKDPSLKQPKKQENDPDTITDEEFEKQQKKERTIIELVVDAIVTFFSFSLVNPKISISTEIC